MGIFAKFAATLVAIPSPVLGGMTIFLFTAVAVSGMAIINRGTLFDRRTRFILTAGLVLGLRRDVSLSNGIVSHELAQTLQNNLSSKVGGICSIPPCPNCRIQS